MGSGHVGSEHLAAEGHVNLQYLGAEGGSGEAGIDGRGMIGKARGRTVPVAEQIDHVEADRRRRRRVDRGALQDRERRVAGLDPRHRGVDFREAAHPGRQDHRQAGLGHPVEHRKIVDLPGGDLPPGDTDATQQLRCLQRERRAQEQQAFFVGVAPQAKPLILGELHAAPIIEAGLVLRAEAFAPGFRGSAFGDRNVGLKLDRVSAGRRDRVDMGMRHAEAAIMGLGNLADNRARAPGCGIVQPSRGLVGHKFGQSRCIRQKGNDWGEEAANYTLRPSGVKKANFAPA